MALLILEVTDGCLDSTTPAQAGGREGQRGHSTLRSSVSALGGAQPGSEDKAEETHTQGDVSGAGNHRVPEDPPK